MNLNPYESPQADIISSDFASEIPSAIDIEKLRRIIKGQKRLLILILVAILNIAIFTIFTFCFADNIFVVIGFVIYTFLCVGSTFVLYPLAIELVSKPHAILLSLAAILPQLNWIMLVVLHQRVKKYLRDNRINAASAERL